MTLNSATVLYLLHTPFQFIPTQIGYFLGGTLLLKFLGSLFINLVFVHCLRMRDFYVMLISFSTYTGMFISMAAAKTDWQIYAGIISIIIAKNLKAYSVKLMRSQ